MSLLGVRVALLEEAAEKGVELVGTVAGQQVPGLSDLHEFRPRNTLGDF